MRTGIDPEDDEPTQLDRFIAAAEAVNNGAKRSGDEAERRKLYHIKDELLMTALEYHLKRGKVKVGYRYDPWGTSVLVTLFGCQSKRAFHLPYDHLQGAASRLVAWELGLPGPKGTSQPKLN